MMLGYFVSILAVIMQMSVLGIVSFVEWWLSKWLDRASMPIKFQVFVYVSLLSFYIGPLVIN